MQKDIRAYVVPRYQRLHVTLGSTHYSHSSLKSQVVLLQTAHSWANAGVLLGARMHRERGSFRNN